MDATEPDSVPVRARVAGFAHLSSLDVVGWLPAEPPDARILYDANPVTFGDLRLPRVETSGRHPVVILIHGGAWESLYSVDYLARLAESLTREGFATWNLEFRRLGNPGGGYPGTFQDVARGIDHVRALAEEWPIDPDRVVLVGHSSGGHLASWAAGRATISPTSLLYTDDPLLPRGLIDLAGVLDLEHALRAGRDDIHTILGTDDDDELADRARNASPIHLFPRAVPQTLIIGTDDSPWRIESHERYRDAGVLAGDEIELVRLLGANHFDVVDIDSPAWPAITNAAHRHLEHPALAGPQRAAP